jgi:hypothetical protein
LKARGKVYLGVELEMIDLGTTKGRRSCHRNLYNVQVGYGESYASNMALPITGNLNGRSRDLSAQSAKLNITMLSVLGVLEPEFGIKVPVNGQHKLS